MGLFAKHIGTRIHIFHLSSRDGLEMIEEWRAKGVDVTCETGAHYCFLSSDDMRTLGAMLRMNPPVREPGHGEALFQGLVDGRVNGIATDHSPHTRQEKMHDNIWQALSGFAGDHYVFSILQNGWPISSSWARVAQDRFATVLAASQ